MPGFTDSERRLLLSVKGVGPTVVARLEQLGIDSLENLARQDAATLCAHAATLVGGTCWRNSPQARAAIEAVITAARQESSSSLKKRTKKLS